MRGGGEMMNEGLRGGRKGEIIIIKDTCIALILM
jgi:hypothetical protein